MRSVNAARRELVARKPSFPDGIEYSYREPNSLDLASFPSGVARVPHITAVQGGSARIASARAANASGFLPPALISITPLDVSASTLLRSSKGVQTRARLPVRRSCSAAAKRAALREPPDPTTMRGWFLNGRSACASSSDRKSTRLNSSHLGISY